MPLSTATLRSVFNGAGQTARAFSTSSPRAVARTMITGRLANEPTVSTTNSGREVIKYTVASDHGNREARQTSFFRISSFLEPGPKREFILSLQRGSLVFVEGDTQIRQFEDAEGKRQSSFIITQRSLELLRRPNRPGFQGQGENQGQEEFPSQ